ncbi:tetratricopeptide repeat protein [Ideonella sp.]|uniref:tetratricopeptide repeat protein n=1 Tax=Ideonella sp. TaxID=1929293 RepID=UPI002B49D429|nr:tetratricopeptide repeat protein [Ideonella sp.]HJV69503.1 tetratricopeptide repeat protein [Ideonella sp.]
MASKRPLILMTVLLGLIAAYVAGPHLMRQKTGTPAPSLPGSNSMSDVKVHQEPDGHWVASLDYFYTGAPAAAVITVQLARAVADGPPVKVGYPSGYKLAQRGTHHLDLALNRPQGEESSSTDLVLASMGVGQAVLATHEVNQHIDWPDFQTWAEESRWRGKSSHDLLKQAVADIDSGQGPSLQEAKTLLERILSKDPKFTAAYIELARVAMKTNWGPEGLHQAEVLLTSALQIEPESANAKILMGYVYAHQHRYKQAETLFVAAAASKPANLWLWTNWGEMLSMEGASDAAIEKYKVAVQHAPTHDTYDRARMLAYDQLLSILGRRHDLDGMEALHKQRVAEYGAQGCYGVAYGDFALHERGDIDMAVQLARTALDQHCSEARDLLGLAFYSKWARSTGASDADALNQARIYLPAGARPIYLLATSDRTATALPKLMALGERIDQMDNDKFDALAYALRRDDLAAARRLLRFGANPYAPVGDEAIPVALLPVIERRIDAIHLMQRSGVDYAKLRYRGVTALDHAKEIGDKSLLDILTPRPGA